MNNKVTRRLLSIFVCWTMAFSLLPQIVLAAGKTTYDTTDQEIAYQYYDSVNESWNTGILQPNTYNLVDTGTSWNGSANGGWYVVGSDVTISSRVSVSGDVKLLLTDGHTLTCSDGISVTEGNSITIYAQSGEQVGTLNATVTGSDQAQAAIGGVSWWNGMGDIFIHGGNISASSPGGPGIGPGYHSSSVGRIEIYGGNIIAEGEVGIGGTRGQYSCTAVPDILVTGGNITAIGGSYGAGIGGYEYGQVGTIIITGGNITATGAVGIGSPSGTGGSISISGDSVFAEGEGYGGYGIRLGSGGVFSFGDGADETLLIVAKGSRGGFNVETMPSEEEMRGFIVNGNTAAAYDDYSLPLSGESLSFLDNVNIILKEGVELTLNGSCAPAGITIPSSSKLNVTGDINVSGGSAAGEIQCGGTFTNRGSLTVQDTGKISCVDFSNTSTLTAESGSVFMVENGLSNTGNITIDGTVSCDTINNERFMQINNTGELTCNGGTNTVLIYNDGTFTNKGQITGENGYIVSTTPVEGTGGQLFEGPFTYLDENGEESFIPSDDAVYPVTVASSSWQNLRGDGENVWYIAANDLTIDGGVSLPVDVNLLLLDGVTLTINEGHDNGAINASGHTLNIYAQSRGSDMGKLITRGEYYRAAIGGQSALINIYGGYVEANGAGRGGFGWSDRGSSGLITISGGIVKTDKIGRDGDVGGGGTGGLSAPMGSNAVIYVSAQDRLAAYTQNNFHGILFLKGNGQVYGDQELAMDLTIEEGETLTIPTGTTWTIPQGVTLTVAGTLDVQGTIINNGAIANQSTVTVEDGGEVRIDHDSAYSGDKPSQGRLSYEILWDTDGNGKPDDTDYVPEGEMPTHEDGSKEATEDTVYTFTGWHPSTSAATEPVVYTAQFGSGTRTYAVTLPENPEGYVISTRDDPDGIEYNHTFTFTVDALEGYSKTESFEVMANNQRLTPDGNGKYSVTVLKDTEITVEGVADITPPEGDIIFAGNTVTVPADSVSFELYYNENVEIAITGADDGSGVKSIEYYRSDEILSKEEMEAITGWTEYTGPISEMAQDMDRFIYYVRISDNAGNRSVFASTGAVFDLTPPENIRVSYETDSFREFLNTITFGLFFKDTVEVTICAEDTGSGVKEITYKLGNSNAVTKTAENGEITFRVEPQFKGNISGVIATDNADNSSDGKEYEYFAVDNGAPAAPSVEMTAGTEIYSSHTWTNQDVIITVSGAEATSGIAKYQYSTDAGSSWNDMDATAGTQATTYEPANVTEAQLTVTAETAMEGTAYLFRAVSGAGTTGTASDAVVVMLDKTPPVISGITEGETYYTTQRVMADDTNMESVTVNGEAAGTEITLAGNRDITYSITAKDMAGNETTVTVTMKTTESISEVIENITPDCVTSDDKDNIEDYLEDLYGRLEDENLTDEEKDIIEGLVDEAEELLGQIEQAGQAGSGEAIEKVQNITADTVTPEDKTDLEQAKEDIESALENYGGNYTDEEKVRLEETLERIEAALEVIERIEEVEAAIEALPDSVIPSDMEAAAQINAAKNLYDQLSDYEKSFVSNEAKAKLEDLLAQMGDYRITGGDGSVWTKGSGEDLMMTANGALEKFGVLKIDGETISSGHYTVSGENTVITIKADYLETLTFGGHTVTVLYTDGAATGAFTVVKQSEEPGDTSSPQTGDNSYIAFWAAVTLAAGAGLVGIAVYRRKKKQRSK